MRVAALPNCSVMFRTRMVSTQLLAGLANRFRRRPQFLPLRYGTPCTLLPHTIFKLPTWYAEYPRLKKSHRCIN